MGRNRLRDSTRFSRVVAHQLRLAALRNRCEAGGVFACGEYFSSNVGDYLMGSILRDFLSCRHRSVRLSTPRQLQALRSPSRIICGGGELGDREYFERVLGKVAHEKLAIVGTSPYVRLDAAGAKVLNYLKNVSFFCVRSRASQSRLQELLDREDIEYAPDIVFSALPHTIAAPVNQVNDCYSRTVGINLIPFYADVHRDGTIRPSMQLREMFEHTNNPLASGFESLFFNYNRFALSLLSELQKQYDRIEIMPFSVGDYVYSRQLCGALRGVKVLRPIWSIDAMLSRMRQYHEFVATRFHAHILAIMATTPLRSIAYSSKCLGLLEDLKIQSSSGVVSRSDFITNDPATIVHKLLTGSPLSLSKDQLHAASLSSQASLDRLRRWLDSGADVQ